MTEASFKILETNPACREDRKAWKSAFSSCSVGKESACNSGDAGLVTGWEDPLEEGMASHPSIFLPGESYGQWRLAVYRPWGHKKSDTTEVTDSSSNNWKTLQGKKLQFLLPLVAFGRGHLSWTWTFCKDLQKKGLAITSPVTPAKLYFCIVIIIVLIALNVVLLFTFVAVRSRKPDSHVLYVTCPKGWIGFGYKCFYFSEDSKNWTFSQTFCTSLGAVLVQFETEEELNFLKRYKDSSDHWIGLSRESSHHPWKWTDNSTYNASFVITGTGEYAYLNDVRISSSRVYANRKWICSKTNSNVFIPLSTSRPV